MAEKVDYEIAIGERGGTTYVGVTPPLNNEQIEQAKKAVRTLDQGIAERGFEGANQVITQDKVIGYTEFRFSCLHFGKFRNDNGLAGAEIIKYCLEKEEYTVSFNSDVRALIKDDQLLFERPKQKHTV